MAKFPLAEHAQIQVLYVMMRPEAPVLLRSGSLEENGEVLIPPPKLLKKDTQATLDEKDRRLRSFRKNVKSVLTVGTIAAKILQIVDSQQINLLVVVSRWLSAVNAEWLGSVSRELISACKC